MVPGLLLPRRQHRHDPLPARHVQQSDQRELGCVLLDLSLQGILPPSLPVASVVRGRLLQLAHWAGVHRSLLGLSLLKLLPGRHHHTSSPGTGESVLNHQVRGAGLCAPMPVAEGNPNVIGLPLPAVRAPACGIEPESNPCRQESGPGRRSLRAEMKAKRASLPAETMAKRTILRAEMKAKRAFEFKRALSDPISPVKDLLQWNSRLLVPNRRALASSLSAPAACAAAWERGLREGGGEGGREGGWVGGWLGGWFGGWGRRRKEGR